MIPAETNVVDFSERHRQTPAKQPKHEDEPTAEVIVLPIIRVERPEPQPKRPRR